MKEDGLVIVDSELVHGVLWGKVASLPLRQITRKAVEERAINVAALGAIASICPFISSDSLAKAVAKRLPSAKVAANLSVFDEALKVARDLNTTFTSIETEEEFEI